MVEQTDIKMDAREEHFRKRNQWYSFTTAAYGALGMAAFFGALGTLANGLIGLAAQSAGNTMLAAAAAIVTNPASLAVIGGLVAVGLAFTYMSQCESTELRVLQDQHMAQQQAKCMLQGKAPAIEQEHHQNCRADGKKWEQVVAANRNQPTQAASAELM